MRIIRHLSGQLLLLTLCVTAVLTTAIWLTQSLRFISIIVLQGVAFSTFLGLMLWILPDLILLALPVGFLVSVLFLYNKVIAEHEFVILKTAGCSSLFLLRPIFWVGGVGVAFLYLVSLYLLPLSLQTFREKEVSFRTKYSQAMIHEGEFTSLGEVVVYIDRYDSEGFVHGLFVYDNREANEPVTIMAEKAIMGEGDGGLKIVLLNGNRQSLGVAKKKPSLLKFAQYTLVLSPEMPGHHVRKPYEMFLSELLSPKTEDPSENRKLRAEAYQRLLMPLYMLCFGLLGGLCLLCSPETRLGRQKAMIGAVFFAFLIEIGSMLILQSDFLPGFSPFLATCCVLFPFFWVVFLEIQARRYGRVTQNILTERRYS